MYGQKKDVLQVVSMAGADIFRTFMKLIVSPGMDLLSPFTSPERLVLDFVDAARLQYGAFVLPAAIVILSFSFHLTVRLSMICLI